MKKGQQGGRTLKRVTTGIRMISWQCETVKTKLGHSDIENSNKERKKKGNLSKLQT